MRKSNNYNKFLEYIAFGVGSNHGNAISTDNGVLECVAEAKVEDFEGYSRLFNCKYAKMAMDSNTWLKFKVVLVNEEVIEVYYVAGSHETHIDTFVLDNFRTQKDVLSAVHQKVVEFFLNSDRFCKVEESSEVEDLDEYDEIKAIEDLERELDEITENEDLDEYEEISDRNNINFPTISELYNDKCFCCPVDRKGNECKGKETCGKTWKRYEAIIKPEWHHVSLATIANLDFDMLDEKRQRYITVYRELQETLECLRKCKTVTSYDKCYMHFIIRINTMRERGKISNTMQHYIESKLSMQNVESGVWASYSEKATGYRESRRYNKSKAFG